MAADREAPPLRIICDTCMADVVVERILEPGGSSRLLLRCHDTEEVLFESRLPGHNTFDKPKVHVWSNLVNIFMSEHDLYENERREVESMLAKIANIRLYHRVRRAQGAAPTYFDVDEAVDTLMLFRRDPNDPAPLPPPGPTEPEPPRETSEAQRNRLYLEALEQKRRTTETMRTRAGKSAKKEPF